MKSIAQKDFSRFENVPVSHYESSSFRYAFYLLPKEKHIAITNIYAFCSYLDNIVDEPIILQSNNTHIDIIAARRERIDWWKSQIDNLFSNKIPSDLLPLWQAIEDNKIPKKYFDVLIDGIGTDLDKHTYSTFNELLGYCYGVASIVGLICLNIFTDNVNDNMRQYAINLGYALQLTNIMRDVGIDAQRGYFYLPEEHLEKFNYTYEDILQNNYNQNFINLMEYYYDITMDYYKIAQQLISTEDKKTFRVSEAMTKIYFNLLQKIKNNNFNVYRKKISLSKLEKISALWK